MLGAIIIAVACPEWRGLKGRPGTCCPLSRQIAVACPEWRGLKVFLQRRANGLINIAVACPEWRGLKVRFGLGQEVQGRNCSGLPRMEGTESCGTPGSAGRCILLQWLAPNGGD